MSRWQRPFAALCLQSPVCQGVEWCQGSHADLSIHLYLVPSLSSPAVLSANTVLTRSCEQHLSGLKSRPIAEKAAWTALRLAAQACTSIKATNCMAAGC